MEELSREQIEELEREHVSTIESDSAQPMSAEEQNKRLDELWAERMTLVRRIREEGQGAGVYWREIATSAMAGSSAAKEKIAEYIGHPIRNLGDIYNFGSAAYDAMTNGEQDADRAKAVHSIGRDVSGDADKYLANHLADMRRAAGMSQRDLANATGIPLSTIQKFEHYDSRILNSNVQTLIKIAKALNTTVDALVDAARKS